MNEERDGVSKRSTPDLPALMSVADANIVKTLPIHIRGSYLTLGKPVERGFPEVMRTQLHQADPAGETERPPRTRALDGEQRASADRARHGESRVALAFRRRAS